GFGSFADDGFLYREEIHALTDVMQRQGVVGLIKYSSQFHVKLYALVSAPFTHFSNVNVLTIEPLNLIYYLAMLVFCYHIGRCVFGKSAGIAAAIIIGLWPSFLLHSTQLLRDPLLITSSLALGLVVIDLLFSRLSIARGLVQGILGCVAVTT